MEDESTPGDCHVSIGNSLQLTSCAQRKSEEKSCGGVAGVFEYEKASENNTG